MADSWTVDGAEAGSGSIDSSPRPIASALRTRAAKAIARGKIFVNDREAAAGDGGIHAHCTDASSGCGWIGRGRRRAASARPGPRPADSHEDAAIVVLNKPPRVLSVPLERRGEARRSMTT